MKEKRLEYKHVGDYFKDLFKILIPGKHIIIFDTETTGVGINSKIIQFSGRKYLIDANFKLILVGRYETYINPEEKLKAKITEITGLTNDFLKEFHPEEKVAPDIINFLESADIWAAYNDQFDLRQIEQMCERVKWMYERCPSIDILTMARKSINSVSVSDYTLGTVFEYLFPDANIRFHDAGEDVEAAKCIMERLIQSYLENGEESLSNEITGLNLIKASPYVSAYSNNPKNDRIRLLLDQGEKGDIFYDCYQHCWSHKQTKRARELFKKCNFVSLEKQVFWQYNYFSYRYNSFDELACSLTKYVKSKRKKETKEAV